MSVNSPIGALPDATLANDQPWTQDFRWWQDKGHTLAVQVAGAAAWLKGRAPLAAGLGLTTAAGTLVISSGVVGVRVPLATMRGLKAGAYDFELQMTDAAGAVRQVRGAVTLIAGLG